MSIKQNRIKEEIRHIVSKYVVENLPPSFGIVSITRVELSGDGSKGRVYFTVIPEENGEKVKEFLEENRKEIRRMIKELRIKVIPQLEFYVDKENPLKVWEGNG